MQWRELSRALQGKFVVRRCPCVSAEGARPAHLPVQCLALLGSLRSLLACTLCCLATLGKPTLCGQLPRQPSFVRLLFALKLLLLLLKLLLIAFSLALSHCHCNIALLAGNARFSPFVHQPTVRLLKLKLRLLQQLRRLAHLGLHSYT